EAMVIIWDELPMANKAAWDCVDLLCHHVMQHFNLPFGGKLLIGSAIARPKESLVHKGDSR
ncbi:hypothetical protein EV363DRAFT_1158355, partial [Boletus edulis]